MHYALAIFGTWILADGISSLYTYTATDKKQGQRFWADHSFRLLRCLVGVGIIVVGAVG